MRIVVVMKVMESGCVLPTSTCLIQVHNAQMVGERYSHQFAHVEGKWIQTSNSVNYTSYGIPYSRVCGRIIAYQFGHPNGFGAFNRGLQTLDVAYVDGISVTYGHPRNHIWTFAAMRESHGTCPCITDRTAAPSFVNGAHFCEVGISNDGSTFLDGNPLWDGQGCVASFGGCCQRNNPPWFCKQLDQPTAEDIELRIMSNTVNDVLLENEDTPVQLIEIFVQ